MTIGRPRCGSGQRQGTAHAQGAQARLRLWPFPRTASGLSPAVGSDGQGVGGGQRQGTAHTQGAQRCDSVCGLSPDGQRIVTGSEDETAKVWEAASGRELLTLKGHSDWIWSVAFSPDGQRIVTGSGDKRPRSGRRPAAGNCSRSRGTRSDLVCGLFPGRPADCHRQGDQTAKVGSGQRQGTAHAQGARRLFGLWPFPRTASGLSPAVGIRRPRCGRRPAVGNCSRSRGTATGFVCGVFPGRPADCHRQRG